VSQKQGYDFAAQVIEWLLPTLERTGTCLALEPLSPRITNFMRTAEEAMRLVRRIDSEHCRLTLDCLAMSSEKEPIPVLIRRYGRWLAHFHANDPNSRGPGFGKLDFVPIMAALRDVGYEGWVSVEVFDFSPGPDRLAKKSIEYLKECVAKVNRSSR